MAVETPAEAHDRKSALYGMWFFLYTELLFFGGMFLLYSVFRSRFEHSFHIAAGKEDLALGTTNTAILLTSSLTMVLSVGAIRRGDSRRSILLQASTALLGIVFLVIKYLEWHEKIAKGIYPDSPVFAAMEKGQALFFSLYYVMTGIHALHVLIGIGLISFMIYFTTKGSVREGNFSRLENTGLYWHFVDIVWIYLYPIFYLIT